jgi:DNA-binding HxlR family transcriptional regulator
MSTDQTNKLGAEVNHAIKVLGDDHILCIIANLRDGGLRFNELQRALEINPTTLTDRLTKLEQEGIVDKKKETLDKISVVYELTKKGLGILPIMNEFEKFAGKFPQSV